MANIETSQMLAEDYQTSKDKFRKVSKYKKPVATKRTVRSQSPPPPRFTSEPPVVPMSKPALASPPAPPSPPPAFQKPMIQATRNSAGAPPMPSRSQAEVLAVPPSQTAPNPVQECTIHNAQQT